jgi:hypothetical protein
MTDQEHVEEINRAACKLNESMDEARKHGLEVTVAKFAYSAAYCRYGDLVRVKVTKEL